MTRKRRSFMAEYNQQIVQIVVDNGLKMTDVRRDQDLGETAIHRWLDQLEWIHEICENLGLTITRLYTEFGQEWLRY